jgi:hypothetical protein
MRAHSLASQVQAPPGSPLHHSTFRCRQNKHTKSACACAWWVLHTPCAGEADDGLLVPPTPGVTVSLLSRRRTSVLSTRTIRLASPAMVAALQLPGQPPATTTLMLAPLIHTVGWQASPGPDPGLLAHARVGWPQLVCVLFFSFRNVRSASSRPSTHGPDVCARVPHSHTCGSVTENLFRHPWLARTCGHFTRAGFDKSGTKAR